MKQLQLKGVLFLALFFAILWGVALGAAHYNSCWLYSSLLGEHSAAELLTFVFYFFAIIAFYRLYKFEKRLAYLPGFFLNFFIMMEEVNWGQTLLTRTDLQPITAEFALHESTTFIKDWMLFEATELAVYGAYTLFLLVKGGLLGLAALLPLLIRLPFLLAADSFHSCSLNATEEILEMLLGFACFYLPTLELVLEARLRALSLDVH